MHGVCHTRVFATASHHCSTILIVCITQIVHVHGAHTHTHKCISYRCIHPYRVYVYICKASSHPSFVCRFTSLFPSHAPHSLSVSHSIQRFNGNGGLYTLQLSAYSLCSVYIALSKYIYECKQLANNIMALSTTFVTLFHSCCILTE